MVHITCKQMQEVHDFMYRRFWETWVLMLESGTLTKHGWAIECACVALSDLQTISSRSRRCMLCYGVKADLWKSYQNTSRVRGQCFECYSSYSAKLLDYGDSTDSEQYFFKYLYKTEDLIQVRWSLRSPTVFQISVSTHVTYGFKNRAQHHDGLNSTASSDDPSRRVLVFGAVRDRKHGARARLVWKRKIEYIKHLSWYHTTPW